MDNDKDLYKKERVLYHSSMNVKHKPSYNYYDTPDGQDFLPKLWATMKLGIFVGCTYGGLVGITTYSGPRRIMVVVDAARRAFPFVLFPIVYTTTTYSLTNIRQKDEVINAKIGGAVAGLVFGVWHKNIGLTFVSTLFSSIFCGLKKQSVQLGIEFPPKEAPRLGESTWALRKLDFTLTKDVTGKPPPPKLKPPPPTTTTTLPSPPPNVCDGL